MKIEKTIKITEDLVYRFSELSGDRNPIHLNDDFAKKSIFGRRIAHGMLVSSYFSSIIAENFIGAIYLSQTLKFLKPCYIDDTLLYTLSITDKDKKKYTISTEVFNVNGELILSGVAIILYDE